MEREKERKTKNVKKEIENEKQSGEKDV